MVEQEVIEKLQERIGKIHNGKSTHSFNDLRDFLDAYMETFHNAMQKGQIYPYMEGANSFLDSIEILDNGLQSYCMDGGDFLLPNLGHLFSFNLLRNETEKALNLVNVRKMEMEKDVYSFNEMAYYFSQNIQLEVMPNDAFDGEKIYLNQGKLIMPTTIKSKGYHVFNIKTEDCYNCNKEHVLFNPITEYGLDSLEEAVEKHVNKNMIGTLAIARNTENYPLRETTLPIIVKKYEDALYGQS